MSKSRLALLSIAVCSACGSSDDAPPLRVLAEQFASLDAAEVKGRLDRMTVHEHFVLEFVGKAFKETVFRRACEADGALQWHYLADQSPRDCPLAAAEWEQYKAFVQQTYGSLDTLNESSELGRNDVIIYYKCKAGEIDAGSCQLYNSIKGEIDSGAAQTSETISDNIGGTCRVGVDAGCYP